MLGIDLTKVSRFIDVSDYFIKRILTKEELAIFNNLSQEKKPYFLASRWASKEAIFKATQDPSYLKYTILNDEKGKPYILNHEELEISISDEDDYVVAIVIKK